VRGQRERDSEDVFLQLSDEITYSLCGKRPRDSKDIFLQLTDRITYALWVGKGRETSEDAFLNYLMGSRTLCGWTRPRDDEDEFL
jgi:hypothetical protein